MGSLLLQASRLGTPTPRGLQPFVTVTRCLLTCFSDPIICPAPRRTQTHPDAPDSPRRTRRTQNFLRLLRGASGKPRGLNTECVRDAICCSAPGCATEASSSVPSDWDFGAIHRGGESEAQGRGLAGTRAGVGGRAPV